MIPLFSYSANFRIEALHTKIKKIRKFEDCTMCYICMHECRKIKHAMTGLYENLHQQKRPAIGTLTSQFRVLPDLLIM